jgi:hypothetical protein
MLLKGDLPIQTLPLFPKLDKLLIDLLKSLTDDEWHSPTITKLWSVKDITSHLLDGNLRGLSYSRDNYFGEKPPIINTYSDLVSFINQQNLTWTNASKRISPPVLIELLTKTGQQYHEHLATLKPFDEAIFSVAWAGQETSENWFHIAREYTEKFIHQQQIRDALGKQALFTRELFYPVINTLMYGLPLTYQNTIAEEGTIIRIKILTEIGGEWNIRKTKTAWQLIKNVEKMPNSTVCISPDIAWKLFSKGMSPQEAYDKVEILGNKSLGQIALQMVSVMA